MLTRFAESNRVSSYLKVECSPKLLLATSPEEVQPCMDGIATELLEEDYRYGGVTLHLALDVQGSQPMKGFSDRFVCCSTRKFIHDGLRES